MSAIRPVGVVRSGGDAARDHVAVELPLEVRLNGHSFAVIMRTPGADTDLALGFLFSEGVVRRRDDVARLALEEEGQFADVRLARGREDAAAAALAGRREVAMNSSCGLCGRRALESLDVDAPPCRVQWSISQETIGRLPDLLRSTQSAFAETGGLHAAGLFDLEGRLVAAAEDVGRHNAVDKLLGRMLDAGRLPLDRLLLFVSGRSSFEIMQKAWLAGVPFVAAVSAPSSLAVDLAQKAGITLLGFVREGRFNIYAHPDRVVL